MKAILTGHSRGIGAALAAELLARGIPTMGIARHRGPQAGGYSAFEQVELDLSDTAALAQWIAGPALHDFLAGSSTVLLINNAGVVQPVGPLTTQDPAAVARAVGVNVAAPLMLAAAVAAVVGTGVERRILHVSSGAGRSAYPGWSVYCATKAALDHHARAAVLDGVPNLRICSLAPGVIDTDMQAEIRATPLEQFPIRERFEAMKREGALSDPADCASRILDYLLSDGFGMAAVADLREI